MYHTAAYIAATGVFIFLSLALYDTVVREGDSGMAGPGFLMWAAIGLAGFISFIGALIEVIGKIINKLRKYRMKNV